jgi:hypothetical protein
MPARIVLAAVSSLFVWPYCRDSIAYPNDGLVLDRPKAEREQGSCAPVQVLLPVLTGLRRALVRASDA